MERKSTSCLGEGRFILPPILPSLSEREVRMWHEAFTSARRRPSTSSGAVEGAVVERFLSSSKDDETRPSIIDQCRSDDSAFCHDLTTKYGFTEEQMHRAAERFKLGRSKSGKTIYWMIDDLGRCLDGRICGPVGERLLSSSKDEKAAPELVEGISGSSSFDPEVWVSSQIKRRYHDLVHLIPPTTHCFFGLHQVSQGDPMPIGIVESERSAVILSELQPKLIWLAYVYAANCTIEQFAPLQGYKVTLYPRTDPCQEIYVSFLELADQIRHVYRDIDITVSAFLEDHASESQKSRHIDLVDFLFPCPAP